MISERLKKVIFDKLYNDLSNVEIIPYNNNIWFIDRDNKYWYFELKNEGNLWWRYSFFTDFFQFFSMTFSDFQPIISEWVEEVLKCKVLTITRQFFQRRIEVQEVLEYKVSKINGAEIIRPYLVEEILDYKVNNTIVGVTEKISDVNEVLSKT